ncbi:hypothetical protein SAMN05216326_10924 [Nitrosomonas marina]|uniref:Dicarboxylate transport n=2 Tax=Nitrosomonas marina TaxID=917 RepID=A0A1I0B299_9PROT|nr:hypothetical protein SAMN05216326_10924 [Nitrosomonas marina]
MSQYCSSGLRNRPITVISLILIACVLMLCASTAFSRFAMVLDDIKHPAFEMKTVLLHFVSGSDETGEIEIVIGEFKAQDYIWKNIRLSCSDFQYGRTTMQCEKGYVRIPEFIAFPVALHVFFDAQTLIIKGFPAKNESWEVALEWNNTSWQGIVTIHNISLDSIAKWFPDQEKTPIPGNGRVSGNVSFSGDGVDLRSAAMDLSVEELAFSDRDGLHAGENINLSLKGGINRTPHQSRWHWHGDVYWQQGEVFWQPIYMVGSDHYLNLQGIFDGETIRLMESTVKLNGLGIFHFTGIFNLLRKQLSTFELKADGVRLAALYEQLLQPFLRNTALAEIQLTGNVDWLVRMEDGVVQSLQIDLDEVNIEDARNRFAFHRINAHIPWLFEGATVADISILSGHVLSIPLGAVRVPLELNQFDIFLPQVTLPVLDGHLKLENFGAKYTEDGWRWKFNGGLSPISMEALTSALQTQPMRGTLSGYIPEVSFDGNTVSVNGVLQLSVFDGSVVMHNLKLIEPMGLAPHLMTDIAMRNLDLELLTGTFSFGKVEGRVDIDVLNLELANWVPVHFDAHLFSSPGSYSRRISQAAIENISALGGKGAVAAIQRSFLRFFEEFRYAEIGWRCKLRLDICYMGGIDSESESRYTLIQGGGIPAITVIGYNREVGWQELISRLQRITSENEPIIQ